jgi:arginyl-tRNA synthetase
LKHKCPWVERITVVEPGFVNFILGERALYDVLTRRAPDYIEIFSREHVHVHWKKKLQAFLEEDGCKDSLRDLQYVHSRIHSILKLLREEGIKLEVVEEEQISYENSDLEKEVLRRLGIFPQQVESAQKHDKPDEILKYGIGLGKLFFKLHEKTLFRQMERPRLYGALRIMEAMGLTIKTILEAFEIEAPEKM